MRAKDIRTDAYPIWPQCGRSFLQPRGGTQNPGPDRRTRRLKPTTYELHEDMNAAIEREKEWKRQWKLELIEKTNRDWHDSYQGLL
jgi:hypothetical protein